MEDLINLFSGLYVTENDGLSEIINRLERAQLIDRFCDFCDQKGEIHIVHMVLTGEGDYYEFSKLRTLCELCFDNMNSNIECSCTVRDEQGEKKKAYVIFEEN